MPAECSLQRILVVDDEPAIQRFLKIAIDADAYTVHQAATGHEALSMAVKIKPDLILLDLGLPDMDGIEVLHALRLWSPVPIIILSVRDRETDKVKALDAGADDYLTKPFGVAELMARIRVVLRRSNQPSPDPVYHFDQLEIDLASRRVSLQGQEVSLTPTEFELLRLLATNAGKVLTRSQILKRIWGVVYTEQAHVLRVTISNLRHKIEPDASRPRYILTESGVGYRFKTEDPPVPLP